jgi:hypothetical protein
MANKKIRLRQVPDGFQIKNGKVTKKASYGGGFVTGDQMNYGLVTNYDNNGNGENEDNVRYSLSSVPRDVANIEAEGGETVLSDLNNNGSFGLYNINGPRHSKGGVPMYLPDQSFIFSDTPKMRMNSEDLAQYGLESKKRMTPAQVSKRFPLNEYVAASGSPNSDFITEASADLMLDKNMMSLSKLAFGQEMKKGFSEGVPTAAFPYIQSMGEDPVNFAAMIDQQIAQKRSQAAYGVEIVEDEQPVLPKAQRGNGERSEQSTTFEDLPKAVKEMIEDILKNASNPNDPKIQQQIKLIIDKVGEVGNMVGIDTDQATSAINEIVKIVSDNVEDLSKEGRLPVISETLATIDNMLQEKGIDVRLNMDVGDKGIEDTQEKKDTGLYGDVTMDNLPEFYKNNKELLGNMGYDSYASMEKKLGKEWYKDSEFVEGFQTAKNESLEIKYEEDAELRAELERLNISKEEFIKTYGFRTDGVDGETDSLDGKFGEYTLNRKDFFGLPEEPELIPEPDPEPTPEPKVPPALDFYRQDKAKMDALSKRDRDLFLPDRMAVEQIELDPVLMDPTRAIAAINEQAAIGADAAGMFGPQTLSANLAKNTGTAYKNITNTLAKYDAANVGILNKADAMQAQFDMRTDAAERQNYATVVDGTNLAMQNYMDERNLDREQFADLYANALTNRANTYNLNSLIPYFDIDPRTGGMIENVDTAGLFKPTEPVDPLNKIDQLAKGMNYINANLGDLSKEDKAALLSMIYGTGSLPSNNTTGYQNTPAAGLLPIAGGLGYQGNNATKSRNGREVKIKRPVLPFYIGTTDGRKK